LFQEEYLATDKKLTELVRDWTKYVNDYYTGTPAGKQADNLTWMFGWFKK